VFQKTHGHKTQTSVPKACTVQQAEDKDEGNANTIKFQVKIGIVSMSAHPNLNNCLASNSKGRKRDALNWP
jgi:hypothetical protein